MIHLASYNGHAIEVQTDEYPPCGVMRARTLTVVNGRPLGGYLTYHPGEARPVFAPDVGANDDARAVWPDPRFA